MPPPVKLLAARNLQLLLLAVNAAPELLALHLQTKTQQQERSSKALCQAYTDPVDMAYNRGMHCISTPSSLHLIVKLKQCPKRYCHHPLNLLLLKTSTGQLQVMWL
jgi:hypothetical protein